MMADPSTVRVAQTIRVAIAGNPNSGKTSLFNAITGARQHVGNYPGVTVEKRMGVRVNGDVRFELVDLPGTYSLTSYSPEERIAQQELLAGTYDVVVVVADSGNLERSLVLVAQTLFTDAPLLLCLNMADEARRAGQELDPTLLRQRLGIPVVETVAPRGEGIDELLEHIERVAQNKDGTRRVRPQLGARLDTAIGKVAAKLDDRSFNPSTHPWVAIKLLLGEEAFVTACNDDAVSDEANRQRQWLEAGSHSDINVTVTAAFFAYIRGILADAIHKPKRTNAREMSDAIDAWLTNRILGLPIFAAVMYGVFWLTFTAGEIPMGWIEAGFAALGDTVSGWWQPDSDSALRSLIVDGVIGGVGGVLVFLPNIMLLFLGLALLEDTGYMARAAFLMDRVMHRFGLHGKSFLPMLTGFGCSIPGIMATRTLENERDRLTTMLVLPLMSCGARLPIWMLLIPAFFAPSMRAPMLFMLYGGGVALALALALLLRRSVLRGEDTPFVMELPPYRMPTLGAVAMKMGERSWLYARKAGTVILGISIIMWLITAYPKPQSYDIDAALARGEQTELSANDIATIRAGEELRYSVAGRMGRTIEPLLSPLGFDWKIATGMVGAFAAKEVFVAQMGIVYSMGEVDESSMSLRAALSRDYSPRVGLSMMLFLLIGTPCMATFAITRRESGSWKWAMLQLVGLTGVAYLVSFVVFQVGSLLVL